MTLLKAKKKAQAPGAKRPIHLTSVNLDAAPPVVPVPLPRGVTSALRSIIARDVAVKLGDGTVWLLIVLPTLGLLQTLADWAFDLPWTVRLVLLLLDAGAAGYLVFRFYIQAWRHRLNLEGAALRAEAATPSLCSGLISSVELAAGRGSALGASPLVQELIHQVDRQVQSMNLPRRTVRAEGLGRRARWAVLALAVAVGAAAFFWPRSGVLLERLFLGNVPLPTRTLVIPVSRDESVTLGADLTLSARARGVIPKSGHLHVVYANQDEQDLDAVPAADDPSLFSVAMKNVQQSFRYRFRLNDGTGEEYGVTAKVPPTLASLRCVQTYPAYTGMAEAEMPPGNLALLAGSRIHLEGQATQALSGATLNLQGMNQSVKLDVSPQDAKTFRGEFNVPKEGLTGFSVQLVNTDGVTSIDDTLYQVQLIPDKPPVVNFSAPLSDSLTVLAGSRPLLVYSVSDDFGLHKVALEYVVTPPAPNNGAAPPPKAGEVLFPVPGPGEMGVDQTYTWDISAQKPPWLEGTQVSYWIEATDNNNVTGPGVTQSAKKSLTVVSKAAKVAELRDALGERGTDLDGIYINQEHINEELEKALRKAQP